MNVNVTPKPERWDKCASGSGCEEEPVIVCRHPLCLIGSCLSPPWEARQEWLTRAPSSPPGTIYLWSPAEQVVRGCAPAHPLDRWKLMASVSFCLTQVLKGLSLPGEWTDLGLTPAVPAASMFLSL